jgi:hypothetical protein
MKLRIALAFFIVYSSSFIISPVRAQFWHVLPPVAKGDEIAAGFSNDEKKIFYLNTEGGVGNVWSMIIMDKYGGIIAGPKNPPVQITKFTDHGIVRFSHLLNRPEFVFMRATENGKDFHIYRMKDDGSEQPQDLTPGGVGITNEIIGASYNGRYVYYTNNAVHRDKVDVYRYDTQQFTSDLIFPNDKDYQVLAWTRDQNKLLVEDSSANTLMYYDIETTERTPISLTRGQKISYVNLDPNTLKINMFDLSDGKGIPLATDYSPNCKYIIYNEQGKWVIKDAATGNVELPLPVGARPLAIAPKETLLVYLNDAKLYLYDIAKNKSTELTSVQ